jgi:hypothetical protein
LATEDFRNSDFILLVKQTREKFGVSIEEAHDLIFADEEVRRLVSSRINREPECRNMAWQDIRGNGEGSRFCMEHSRIRFRRPDGQRP